MADGNGNRPRILRPGDEPPQMSSMSHDQFVDAELGLLRAQVRQLQTAFEGQRAAVNIHHDALSALTTAVADLQGRTLGGRWRQCVAWVRSFRDPGDSVAVPAPDPDANPEAMPKP